MKGYPCTEVALSTPCLFEPGTLRAIHVLGLETFRAPFDLKFNLRSLLQCPVTRHLDCREMHKNVLTAGALDKSIALGGVKPFHNTLFSHYFDISYFSPAKPGRTKTLSLSHGMCLVCNQVSLLVFRVIRNHSIIPIDSRAKVS